MISQQFPPCSLAFELPTGNPADTRISELQFFSSVLRQLKQGSFETQSQLFEKKKNSCRCHDFRCLGTRSLTRTQWFDSWMMDANVGKKHNNHHPRHNGWKIELIFETCRGLSEKVLPHSIHWFIMMFLSKNWCHWCFTDFQTLQTPSCVSFSSRSLVAFCAWCESGS